jgi:CCT motif
MKPSITALGLEFPDDNSTGVISSYRTGPSGGNDVIGSSSRSTGGRNRAFSFECFAFGINADEPLPPLDQQQQTQPQSQYSLGTPANNYNTDMVPAQISSSAGVTLKDHNEDTSAMNNYPSHPIGFDNRNNNNYSNSNSQYTTRHAEHQQQRPRGDSIIFDPISFQEGGIHELLPGMIEQEQQQQHGSAVVNGALSTRPYQHLSSNSAMNCNPKINSIPKQQKQRYSGQQLGQQKPMSVRPSTNLVANTNKNAHHKRQGHHSHHTSQPMAVVSSSSLPYAPAQARSVSQPQQQQYRKSINATTSNANAQQQAQQQQQQQSEPDLVTTIHADGTTSTVSLDLCNKEGRIGIYLPEDRIARIARFHAKRSNRIWRKRIKYDCRKKLADSRPRIKGRFVKRTDTDE